MKVGDKVRISDSTIFNNKEGILEEINEDNNSCVVFVDFIPEENKKVRQTFDLGCVSSLDSDNYTTDDEKLIGESKNHSGFKSREDNTSGLTVLGSALGSNDRNLLVNYPYSFNLFVSDKFIKSLNELKNTLLNSDKTNTQFFKIFDRCFARLDKFGRFNGVSTERVNGIPGRYLGQIKELKLGEVNGKPIRILYFTLSDNRMILGNIFYHKESSLTASERNSINDIYDNVKH